MNNQRKDQDKKLKSGERQVADNIDKIEVSHIARYKRACEIVTYKDSVLDLGCGCGYGSFLLAQKAYKVTGIDDSEEAIKYARQNWSSDNIHYDCANIMDLIFRANVVVAFEIIEHIKDIDKLFEKLKEWTTKYLIFSVPHVSIPLRRSKWHWKHFTEKEIKAYIKKIGFKLIYLEKVPDNKKKGYNLICLTEKK